METRDFLSDALSDLEAGIRVCEAQFADTLKRLQALRALQMELERNRAARWRPSREVVPQEDKVYLVRRVFKQPRKKPTVFPPAVARWTEFGWEVIKGEIAQTTAVYADLEIMA